MNVNYESIVLFPFSPGRVRGGFRVPNASEKAKGVFHEPAWPSNRSLPRESGAEDARTPNADASSADSAGARSVWSASDLSALSVRRGTASGSRPQCAISESSRLPMNR